MSLRTLLFGQSKIESQFEQSLSTKIKVNDRVRHRQTKELGLVIQTGVVNGSSRVPAISVRYDNGQEAWLLPAEEFTKATRY